MKKKDITIIIVICVISGVFSLVLSNVLIGSPKKHQQTVEKVEPISADFKTPDGRYFNSNSIDPTQLIKIGENTNQSPFNAKP